jgi:hypothetical protein
MTIATPLAQIYEVLGQKMIEADMKRLEIEALRYSRDRELWQERLAALVVFALIGGAIGLFVVTHAVR